MTYEQAEARLKAQYGEAKPVTLPPAETVTIEGNVVEVLGYSAYAGYRHYVPTFKTREEVEQYKQKYHKEDMDTIALLSHEVYSIFAASRGVGNGLHVHRGRNAAYLAEIGQ